MSNLKKDRHVFLALLSGAALGTMAAVLLAPEKGKILRNRIKLRTGSATKKLDNSVLKFSRNMMSKGDALGYVIGSALAKTTVSVEETIDIIERKVRDLRLASDIETGSKEYVDNNITSKEESTMRSKKY